MAASIEIAGKGVGVGAAGADCLLRGWQEIVCDVDLTVPPWLGKAARG